jgi:hypothetical protein
MTETKEWLTHLKTNAAKTMAIPKDSYRLSNAERESIEKSIQSFQLGESSEGHVLMAQARVLCDESGEFAYLECIQHLIREENRHSAYLAAFMNAHGIAKIKRGFNDHCFRFLRRLAGVEWSVRILVIAEIIALTYYHALGQSTGSPVLRAICERMCQEEKDHVRFQLFHIHEMAFRKHGLVADLANIAHALVFIVTLMPVWIEHRTVLRSEHTFLSFFRTTWRDFQIYSGAAQDEAILSLVRRGFLSASVLCG